MREEGDEEEGEEMQRGRSQQECLSTHSHAVLEITHQCLMKAFYIASYTTLLMGVLFVLFAGAKKNPFIIQSKLFYTYMHFNDKYMLYKASFRRTKNPHLPFLMMSE